MSGSVYNCKNHTGYRWFDTKPGGTLIFMGELVTDADGMLVLKEAAYDFGNPMIRLRHYLNNKNPYAPWTELPEPFTYDRLKEFMKAVLLQEELGYVFECECSAGDLQRVDETYESIRSHPSTPKIEKSVVNLT